MRFSLPAASIIAVIACTATGAATGATTFTVPAPVPSEPLVFVAYGDMRFTATTETQASSPTARQALVAKVEQENPTAIFINGDVPWHGIADDYDVFRSETRVWREKHVHVYPALGNHEFSACMISSCLDRWWDTFAELRGRRWYSVAIGAKLVGIALDSDASLLPDSEQRIWLENQIATLDAAVRVVLIVMHHPPVADVQTLKLVDHNPRPNEQSLAAYLQQVAAHSAARFVVSAGHIHNYERLAQDGVMYLVSGGGGATPYEVDRSGADLYQNTDFPNYHYVRFELRGNTLKGEMIRLEDSAALEPAQWKTRDRFEISLRP
jgi:calcineurin-like phosphoesterase family protein